MISKHSNVALIALLLAGCGGGGSDEQAVSANPPAAAAPAPAPDATPPSKIPTPAAPIVAPPAPPPVANPPAAPPPAAPPAGPTIKGSIVAKAMQTVTVDRGGPWGVAKPVGFEAAEIMLHQGPQYQLGTGVRFSDNGPQPGAYYYRNMSMSVTATFSGSMTLANAMAVDDSLAIIALVGPELHVAAAEDVPLTKTLNTWSGAGDTFASLLISENGPAGFNLCWNIATLSLKRLLCNTFERVDGNWRAIYVIDDDLEHGVKEYR